MGPATGQLPRISSYL